jgi:branched-chain amino acid aminotransferase
MPITPTQYIWMDGDMVAWDDATVHILTHGLHYGYGAFEGVRAYPTPKGPAIFRLRDHTQRLLDSCRILMLDVPFSLEELMQAQIDVVNANDVPDGCYLRPLVYLGYGEMGLNPLPCPVQVSVSCWPWGAYLGDPAKGARMKISSWQRHDPNAMPTQAKGTGMYLNSGLAKMEAIRGGYDEAIMLGPDGRISEASAENLFVIKNGVIRTPAASAAGALAGITQDSVVTLARDLGYEVRFEALIRTDLYLADEVFLTGTAAEVAPVASVDDRLVGSGERGPITTALQAAYQSAVKGQTSAYDHWLTYCR